MIPTGYQVQEVMRAVGGGRPSPRFECSSKLCSDVLVQAACVRIDPKEKERSAELQQSEARESVRHHLSHGESWNLLNGKGNVYDKYGVIVTRAPEGNDDVAANLWEQNMICNTSLQLSGTVCGYRMVEVLLHLLT